MSRVRRSHLGLILVTAVVAMVFGAGTAGANPSPTTLPEVTDQIVSTSPGGGGESSTGVSAAPAAGSSSAATSGGFGRGTSASPAASDQALNRVLARTGSSTGLLVISGVILLIIGASLLGGRRAYGH